MKVFKDLLTGDEMFTDTYKYEEIEDAFYMVIGKNTTVTEGNIELAGSNPSAEEADEGTESSSQSGIDVVLFMRLQETGFGSKKDYLTYMKDYLKKLKTKLGADSKEAEKLPGIQKPLQEILLILPPRTATEHHSLLLKRTSLPGLLCANKSFTSSFLYYLYPVSLIIF
ncbi:hypothetical protein Pmani_024306 [Petrolisthes manimaculis]|uniref:Translationally-controlled tumor protein homolog n=1 Tax=Petrolisthes manimaculis TaxID=1843537 RepID=A0AAE1PAH3_9EUCA|nr:hypothetical protein Pmani_024306 [Petrolisthes manimaculis]